MKTVNISLPEKLKEEAQNLVELGYYASLSDLVRDSLRNSIKKNKYDLMADEAETELATGKGKLFRNSKELEKYFGSLPGGNV